MRLYLKKRTPAQIEFGILYGSIAFLVLMAAWFMPHFAYLPSCTFKGLTGIPCPTCGATRCLVHLSHGGVVAAIALNPLVAVSFIAAILHLLYSLVMLAADAPRVQVTLTEHEKNTVRGAVLGLVLINWTYLICNL